MELASLFLPARGKDCRVPCPLTLPCRSTRAKVPAREIQQKLRWRQRVGLCLFLPLPHPSPLTKHDRTEAPSHALGQVVNVELHRVQHRRGVHGMKRSGDYWKAPRATGNLLTEELGRERKSPARRLLQPPRSRAAADAISQLTEGTEKRGGGGSRKRTSPPRMRHPPLGRQLRRLPLRGSEAKR